MAKEITLQQTGWKVYGTVEVTHWDGSLGFIEMDPTEVPLGQMTRDNLHRCINDGKFGVQSIDRANLDIYVVYDGYEKYDRTLEIEWPDRSLVCRGISSK